MGTLVGVLVLVASIHSGGTKDTHKGPPFYPTSTRVPTLWRVPRLVSGPSLSDSGSNIIRSVLSLPFMGINLEKIEKYGALTHSDIMRQFQNWMLALRAFDAEVFLPAGLVKGRQRRQ